MKILVTGAAGLIGSHLVIRLLSEGHDVFGLDRYYPLNWINKLPDSSHFHCLNQDVRESLKLSIDQIYHLACPASPIQYQIDPIDTLKTAVIGTLNMLELAVKCKCPILLASTSEVYGSPHEHPQTEAYWGNVNPIGVRSCYDEGKRCAETLGMDFYRKHQVQVKIVRIFNTYGPYMAQQDGRVISNFIVNALQNEDLIIYGDGSQTRSFQYVDDLIEGLMRMMRTPSSQTGPINLGNPEEITVFELAKKIIDQCSSKSRIAFQSLPEDDPHKRRPDISLAKQLLDWEPKVPLKEGLNHTIEYFRRISQQLQPA